jgi:protein-S-isoprenylcysteine O-methyltransferase Ste14
MAASTPNPAVPRRESRPYSRNLQSVTYVVFPAGYAIMGRTILAWVALVLFWIVVHFIVLIEEEHQERRFGEAYRTHKRDTPRYLFC